MLDFLVDFGREVLMGWGSGTDPEVDSRGKEKASFSKQKHLYGKN